MNGGSSRRESIRLNAMSGIEDNHINNNYSNNRYKLVGKLSSGCIMLIESNRGRTPI